MKTIGKYTVLETIGTGGFAVVYKGFDPDIKRLVAIKVCGSNDPEVRARFYQEAEIAGQLSHRNITAIYEFGVFMQTPFLVEEYLPGTDLAQLIRRGEPSFLLEKLDVLLQIAEGLAYAHRKGVVHRDVKPANVRVLDDGRAKILDFGTAKVIGNETALTQTGMTHGTVAYMAPERLRGTPGHASSDIFSFGALAFELLTFSRAFAGENVPTVIEAILDTGAPDIGDRWPECPPQLADLVSRTLDHEAGQRYPTAVELLADLESFRDAWLGNARSEPTSGAFTMPKDDSAQSEVPALLGRIEALVAEGRSGRARLLLEEALEIAPADDHVRRLAADHGLVEAEYGTAEVVLPNADHEQPERPSHDDPHVADVGAAADTAAEDTAIGDPEADDTAADDAIGDEAGRDDADPATADEQRSRQDEVAASIRTLAESGRLVESARALAFAHRLFEDLENATDLSRSIVDAVRHAIVTVRHKALRQAHRISLTMRRLDTEGRLDSELALHLAERAEDLAPGRTSAQRLAEQTRRRERRTKPDGDPRHREAIASIERLLAEGKTEQASQALQFAIDLIGPFEGADRLSRRIDHERRDG